MSPWIDTLAGFAANLAVTLIIVRLIYFPHGREKRYVFTFFAFNAIIFFVMGLLNTTDLSIGVGFGLFAIFSVLRYRTDTIPIREMTYLFVLIALPVLNSILLAGQQVAEFAVANAAVIGLLYVLEQEWGFKYEIRKTITYERIEMVRPENWTMLMADLRERTGLPIKRIEIGKLNFVRDSADITLVCDSQSLDNAQVKFAANNHTSDDD